MDNSWSGSRQYLLNLCYVVYGITMIFVALGFYSRARTAKFSVADFCILIAVSIFTGKLATVRYLHEANVGLHAYVLSDDQISQGRKVAGISVILVCLTMCAIRCSILLLYTNYFNTPRQLMIIHLLLALVFFICGIVQPLVTALACRPPSIIWGLAFPGDPHCINFIAFNYFSAAFDIAINFLALVPIYTLININVTIRQKIVLIIVFCCGIVIMGPTIAREVYNYVALTHPDFSWNWPRVTLIMDFQISTGIICACVPAIWTILKSGGWFNSGGDGIDRVESRTGIVMNSTREDQRVSICGDSRVLMQV